MRLVLAFALALIAASALACGGPPICTIKDPTGTPLNVRAGPAGKIVSFLRNGAKVEFVEHKEVKGQKWALVSKFEEYREGWVFESYLGRCSGSLEAGTRACLVADPTGTPLNLREDANGPILGSFRNGSKVSVYERKDVNGKGWARVAKVPEDGRPIGWVFDAYMQCEED